MKNTNKSRRLISALLVLAVFMSMCAVGFSAVSAASLHLDYSFAYKNAGYAQGVITLSGGSSDYGNYYLYWANNEKALDGYSEITSLKLNKDSRYFIFDEFTAIPAGATKVIAVKSDTEPADKSVQAAYAVYDIPAEKQFAYKAEDAEYNFQALSDVHIHKQDPPYYTYSELHFAQALECASQRDAEFVAICGDMINGYDGLYATEWGAYQKIIADSSFCNPIYETNGNHETKSDSDKPADEPYTYGLDMFKTATGLNVQTEAMQDAPYYEVTASNGDHFIFMVLELDSSPNESNEFTQAQMTWLKGLLQKYYGDGKNIFIFEHALFNKYGAGDDKELPLYAGGLMDTYPTVQELKGVLEQYPEVMFFSGHTHIDFKYGYNIDNENGTTAYTVHIPATTSTTQISGGSLAYPMSEDSSQGYFVDIYEDCVILNGTDLTKNTYYPAYTYIIDQSGNALEKNDAYINVTDTDTCSVTVDVSNLSKNTEYVYCYAYAEDIDRFDYPGTKMTENADGTYSAEISKAYDKMSFIFMDSTLGKLGSDVYDVADCKVVIGSEKVTYTPDASWGDNIHVYVWSDTNTTFAWPGIKMTKDTVTGEYYAYIPADTFTMVIFNNGGGDKKTGDLQIGPYVTDGVEGSYTLLTPQTPSSTSPTEPSSTEPSSTEPTENPTGTIPPYEGELVYGDADLDEEVTIKDATLIQKAAAEIVSITDEKAIKQADANCDGDVNIKDATAIQKFIAKIVDSLPLVSESKELAAVGATASQLDSLIASVKTTLADEYCYASYDMYMALKKVYYTYKDKTVASMAQAEIDAAVSAFNTAVANYETMKENNPQTLLNPSGEITVYFTNNYSWSTVKAYAWGSGGTLSSWSGTPMTYVKTNSQKQDIYSITLDYGMYQNIIFNDGSSQTVDIPLTGETGIGYYISGTSGSKYTCSTYTFM